MEEKRCEWCGTLSPMDADKCRMCRIAFGVPVPAPRDWSELTGNIPVITAPLLETTPVAPTVPAPAAPQEAVPSVMQEESRPVARPAAQQPAQNPVEYYVPAVATSAAAPGTTSSDPHAAARAVVGAVNPVAPSAPQQAQAPLMEQQVPEAFVQPVVPAAVVPTAEEIAVPGWRTPDDPTLRLFADRLEERERRRRGEARSTVRRRRGRRRLARLLVWLLAIALITTFLLLAPARLPFL